MPVSREAIEQYFSRLIAPYPHVKDMEPDRLRDIIYQRTGKHLLTKTEPRPYQLEAITYAIAQQRALLFLDMRLGKTKIALDVAEHFHRCGDWKGPGLIVAHSPLALRDTWPIEIPLHSNLTFKCVQNDWNELLDAIESNCDLIVIPWTGLQSLFSVKRFAPRKKRWKLVPDEEKIQAVAPVFSFVIMDEIHKCKNFQSLRYQITEGLVAHCQFRLGLTGTPLARDPLALWAQAFLVDRGAALGKNYFFFRAAFGKEVMNWALKRPMLAFDSSKMKLLQQKLAPVAISYQKDEIHSDNVLEQVVRLNMLPAQQQAYDRYLADVLKRRIQAQKDGIRESPENTFLRMRQCASGFMPFVDDMGYQRLVDFPCAKLEWLENLLEGFVENSVPTVIFHEFIHSGDRIEQLLKKSKVPFARLTGSSEMQRQAVADFRNAEVDILLANTATGGTGIDLIRADYMLFYESPVSPIIRVQARARPLAVQRGRRPLVIEDLVSAPVEERILEYIAQGQDLRRAVMRNPDLLSKCK